MRNEIRSIIANITPHDALEAKHRKSALDWVDSGEEVFRIRKPDFPLKHLVSYFVLIDQKKSKMLLVDHIKAELWLPSGGHVELNEHPKTTVEREIVEELNQQASFIRESPLFITETVTVGKTAGHTDVSLWFILRADSTLSITYDTSEFNGCKWFEYDEILNIDIAEFDLHMHRFVQKFLATII